MADGGVRDLMTANAIHITFRMGCTSLMHYWYIGRVSLPPLQNS